MNKSAVMAFSGGMDSTGLLMHLLADDYRVNALSYDYGQKHKLELERAKANISYLAENNIDVSHEVVDLQSAMAIFHSALTTDDFDIPEGHYAEEQMRQTVVPNRNAIFSSILYGYALSIANKNNISGLSLISSQFIKVGPAYSGADVTKVIQIKIKAFSNCSDRAAN